MMCSKELIFPEGAVTMDSEEQEYVEGGAKEVFETIKKEQCQMLADGLSTMGTGLAEGTSYCSSVLGIQYKILLYCFSALTLTIGEFFRKAGKERGAVIYQEESDVNGTVNPSVGTSYHYTIQIKY